MLTRKQEPLNKSRTNRMESPEGGRRTPFDDSFVEDLDSNSANDLIESDLHVNIPKKIDFNLPKFDKQVIHMLELDPNENSESNFPSTLNIIHPKPHVDFG